MMIGSDDPPTVPPKRIKKISQLEHILLHPDAYIGSVKHVEDLMWVFDPDKGYMVHRQINYCPGLYKIFDEILVNALDNKQRDKRMDCIRIDINQETNTVSVWNNGKGIPVVIHKDENMFVPTMIFGHLTASIYDDDEEKVVGGSIGNGAILCNIFSTKFTVETRSRENKKNFKQTWGNNMTKVSEPKIKQNLMENDFTKITLSPDLEKFHMEKLDDDIVALMSRRAYDVAATSRGVKVFLNGEKIKVNNFKDKGKKSKKLNSSDEEDALKYECESEISLPPRERIARRATTTRTVNYKIPDESSDDDELELFENIW